MTAAADRLLEKMCECRHFKESWRRRWKVCMNVFCIGICEEEKKEILLLLLDGRNILQFFFSPLPTMAAPAKGKGEFQREVAERKKVLFCKSWWEKCEIGRWGEECSQLSWLTLLLFPFSTLTTRASSFSILFSSSLLLLLLFRKSFSAKRNFLFPKFPGLAPSSIFSSSSSSSSLYSFTTAVLYCWNSGITVLFRNFIFASSSCLLTSGFLSLCTFSFVTLLLLLLLHSYAFSFFFFFHFLSTSKDYTSH